MKISLILTGKTTENYLQTGIDIYTKRIKRYTPFEIVVLPDIKKRKKGGTASEIALKEQEGERLLQKIQPGDYLILLDEKGKRYRSVAFANHLQSLFNRHLKAIKFVVGGPYGFSEAVYQRANAQLSLSDMTFSHQLIRLLFVEQLYRAFSILNNEPYHHE